MLSANFRCRFIRDDRKANRLSRDYDFCLYTLFLSRATKIVSLLQGISTKETEKLEVGREVKDFFVLPGVDVEGDAMGERLESWGTGGDSLLQRFRRPGAQR